MKRRRLWLDISRQPDERTCGPTSLQAVYRFFGDEVALEEVIRGVSVLREGGTVAVSLACHALARGYRARLFSYNLRVFDPTWFDLTRGSLLARLREQARHKTDPKMLAVADAYVEFLELGGELRFAELSPRLLRRLLDDLRVFAGRGGLLASHRGWDPGSLELARALAAALGAPLVASTVSRLVVDLNRSRGHPRLFSEITRTLAAGERREILERYHLPHRGRVEALLAEAVTAGRVAVQLAVHTFTPVLDGVERRADVGLLFDPRRPRERAFADELRQALRAARPDLRVRRNYPYLGRADGLVTTLRRRFAEDEYLGLEIEVNQKWPLGDPLSWQRLAADLVAVFAARAGGPRGATAAAGRRRGSSAWGPG